MTATLKKPGPPASLPVEIRVMVSPRMLERFRVEARKRNMPTETYARLLMEAAFAARCGKVPEDKELTASVTEAGL